MPAASFLQRSLHRKSQRLQHHRRSPVTPLLHQYETTSPISRRSRGCCCPRRKPLLLIRLVSQSLLSQLAVQQPRRCPSFDQHPSAISPRDQLSVPIPLLRGCARSSPEPTPLLHTPTSLSQIFHLHPHRSLASRTLFVLHSRLRRCTLFLSFPSVRTQRCCCHGAALLFGPDAGAVAVRLPFQPLLLDLAITFSYSRRESCHPEPSLFDQPATRRDITAAAALYECHQPVAPSRSPSLLSLFRFSIVEYEVCQLCRER